MDQGDGYRGDGGPDAMGVAGAAGRSVPPCPWGRAKSMVAAAETMDPPQVREAAQPEAPGDRRAAARGNAAALVRVSALLSGDTKIDGLDRLYTVDSAHLVLRLKPKRARALLRQLDEAPSLSLLRALDAEVGAQLLDPETTARVAVIVSRLDLEPRRRGCWSACGTARTWRAPRCAAVHRGQPADRGAVRAPCPCRGGVVAAGARPGDGGPLRAGGRGLPGGGPGPAPVRHPQPAGRLPAGAPVAAPGRRPIPEITRGRGARARLTRRGAPPCAGAALPGKRAGRMENSTHPARNACILGGSRAFRIIPRRGRRRCRIPRHRVLELAGANGQRKGWDDTGAARGHS